VIKAENIYGFSRVLHIPGDTCTSLVEDAITTPSPRACRRVGWVVDKLPILDPVATAQCPEARAAD